MKTYLFDYSTHGLLYISETSPTKKSWEFHLLKSCLVDTLYGVIYPKNPLYQTLTNKEINEKFYIASPTGIVLSPESGKAEVFLEKQRRLKLMLPLVHLLMYAVNLKSINLMASFAIPIEDTLAFEISNCNPETNFYTISIREYADMVGITPAQAYREIKLEYETMHYIKMRGYAIVKKYIPLIREVTTEERAEELQHEMEHKLIKDTYL